MGENTKPNQYTEKERVQMIESWRTPENDR